MWYPERSLYKPLFRNKVDWHLINISSPLEKKTKESINPNEPLNEVVEINSSF